MQDLIPLFSIEFPSILCVIGSGGKTSLIWLMVQTYRTKKVLISPTTKMFFPPQTDFDFFRTTKEDCCFPPSVGITLLGDLDESSHKLVSTNPLLLEQEVSQYDLALLEADGSRGFPLKGWESFEPVVPTFTTETIGVLPITSLSLSAKETTIHRFPLFQEITQIAENERVQIEHLQRVVCHQNGLFAKSQGKKILFINQVETPYDWEQAKKLTNRILKSEHLELEQIIVGSVKNKKGERLWTR